MAFSWGDVKNFISEAAPIVGSALGPEGTLVGGLISSALGTENTPDAVMTALQASPDALLKLKTLEATHSEYLANLAAQANASQVDLDKQEDSQPGLFGKWRDGAGWLAVVGLGWGTIGSNLLAWACAMFAPTVHAPAFDTASLISLLISMLGLGALHMNENIKGADHV